MLHRVDRVLAWGLLVLGVMQWASTPVFFPVLQEPAFWWFNGGTTLLFTGIFHLLRIHHGHALPLLRTVALGVTLLQDVFWAAMVVGLWEKFARLPGTFTAPVFLLALTATTLARPARRSTLPS